MSYNTLDLDVRDGVAHLTLDRANAANALDLAMCRELLAASLECEADKSVRAVLLAANGKMFCAGGDLASLSAAGEGAGTLLLEMTANLHAAISRLARIDAPVVAAVQGPAAGAGLSLVAAADLAIAAESARFTSAYTAAGLTPDGSSTYFLPRVIGVRRAQELFLTNRRLTAREALEWGLITRVVPDEELASESEKLCVLLAQGPTRAYGGVKRLIRSSATESLETQMEHESQLIAASARTDDGREGISAFLEKRAPVFRGR